MHLPVRGHGTLHRKALLCALSVAISILLTHPFFEIPVNDDFSYTKSAFDYARTGHILYNGWATTSLGWQVIWGGIFAKLFGYTFTAVRLSLLPFAMGTVYLLFLVLVRFGANTWNAALGSLALGWSPMFVPLAASFMSDVPAVFFILFCLYLCQHAVEAQDEWIAIRWLVLATTTNLLGGTVRQIVWFGALVMVPTAAWLLRRWSRVVVAAALMWVLSILSVVAFGHWFAQQPYAVPLRIWEPPASDLLSPAFLSRMEYLLLTLLAFALPVLVATRRGIPALKRRYQLASYAALAGSGVIFLAAAMHRPLKHVIAPWMGDVVTRYGITRHVDVSPAPLALPGWIWVTVTLLLLLSLVALCCIFAGRPKPRLSPPGTQPIHLRRAVILILPSALAYLATLTLRAMHYDLLNRYILQLLPAVIILFILYYQQRLAERLPWSSAGLLIIFAIYAVTGTHDSFATNHAEQIAAEEVERTGVPRTRVHAFLEYDAWTQLENHGHLNEKLVRIPANSYQEAPHRHLPPEECRFWFSPFIPNVRPQYLVVFEATPCFQRTAFPPVSYRIWLPPFRHTIYIVKQKDGYDWID